MKIKNNRIKISLVFVFIIATLYATLYVFANNDNANSLKNYNVGVVNKDLSKNSLAKNWILNLQKHKQFKVKYYEDEEKLRNDLKITEKQQLGIVIDKNFTKTINNPDDLKRNSQIKFIENSKLSQMSTIANTNIINYAQDSINELTGIINAPQIHKFLNQKIQKLKTLANDVANFSNDVKWSKDDVNNKIDKYLNMEQNLKSEVSEIKNELNLDNIKQVVSTFKHLDLSWLKNLTPEQILQKIASDSNFNINTFSNLITNPELKNNINKYLNDIKVNLAIITKNYSSKSNYLNSNINIKQLLSNLNKVYNVFNTLIKNISLTNEEKNILLQIQKFKVQIDLVITTMSSINLTSFEQLANKLQNLSSEQIVKELFNVNLNQIKQLITQVNDKNNQNDISNKINTLKSGLLQLSDGVNSFNVKLKDVTTKVDFDAINKNSEKLFILAQNPGNVKIKNVTKAQTSGQAIIPFALMLGLWVLTLFSYEFFIVNEKNIFKQILYPSVFLSLFALMHSCFISVLNVSTTNIFAYIGIFNIIGWTFYMLQLFVYNLLKEKAPVLLTLIFIIMIVGSGASVPIELMGNFYNTIYIFDPLHFAINLIREINYEPTYNVIWENIFYLSIWFSILLILNVIFKILKRRKLDV